MHQFIEYNYAINKSKRKKQMTTLVKVGVGAGLVAAAVFAVPALKGPWNWAKTELSDKLNDKFVVENYKVEYVKLYDKKNEVKKNLDKFIVERKVNAKKFDNAYAKVNCIKGKLIESNASNLAEFNRMKNEYETCKAKLENLQKLDVVYSNAIAKLETSYALIESNMQKAKMNVDILSSKKTLVDSVRSVNNVIENINGIGDENLSISVEKLDDDALRESIKLEVFADTAMPKSTMTEAEAKAYIDSLKSSK